ncbi:MMPL family transporter [Pygmaiobacter massiliensis]|uniref:efflux RND transporter permease subunit n=1 Tax=Pygmaiobacter massiliensis TaxID=1917873 RepID=UPI002A810E81|nr:MMPL family transporter [Pygmaiobacter massiliensis]MDY4785195.1 MMPL family transporter [Pygmaiobacter massiliensis]
MERIAKFIVKHRKLVLVVAVLLLIPSIIGAAATRINYDILTYLPPELESMIGEQSLENDFHIAATGMVTVEGMPTSQILKLKDQIAEVDGVSDVFWLSDVLDVSVPTSMLPAEVQDMLYNEEHDATMMVVRFDDAAASKSTMQAVAGIKTLLRENCFFGGMSVILQDTKALVDKEMPMYILCAVGASLVVLFLAIKGTVVPLLFMLGLLFPILYNFGSNIFLGQISYITQALATVLQLGVTMDFSIFLLHRYEEECQTHTPEDAMAKAIQNTFVSLAASSLTTIAGFLALCTMRLTLGRDIGIVMAKGVFLGVLCTITILPSLILCMKKPISKYTHRVFIPQLTKTSHKVVAHHKIILAVFVVCFIPFVFAQTKTNVYYTLFDSLPQDMTGIVGTNKLKEDFGMTTTHFVLVSEKLENKEITQLSSEIQDIDGVSSVVAVEKYLGAAIPEDMLPADVLELFHAGGYRMLMVNSAYESGTDQLTEQLNEMNSVIKKADPNGLITGEGAMTKDLIEIADVDFKNVSIASIVAVFVIIALSFKSLSIPVLLVAAIESAITINMGIPYFSDTTLPFIASIVIGTIQLGATVDYAILMTTRFREERRAGRNAKEAAQISVERCSQSILTSGLTFFAATVGVSAISRMELLQSICLLISRGALISMFVILLILPSLLILLDPIIKKTTIRWISKSNVKE